MSNRLSYTIIGLIALVLIGTGVYAFGAVPNPGHTLSQLQGCDSAGQILNWTGSAWSCVSAASGNSGSYFGGRFYPVGTVFTCNPGNINFTVTVTSNGFTSRCYSTDFSGNPESPSFGYDSGVQEGLFAHKYVGANNQWCIIGSPTWAITPDGNLNPYGITSIIPYGLITAGDRIVGVGRNAGNTLACVLISPPGWSVPVG